MHRYVGAALAAGLAIAFLGSQLRPVFTDANELRLKTGLPLLGVISIGDLVKWRIAEAHAEVEAVRSFIQP